MRFKAVKRLTGVTGAFFDRAPVMNALDRASRRVLSRFGAFVRRTARTSLRMARRKRWGELSGAEKRVWHIRAGRAKRAGRAAPRLPETTSRPGAPPKLHMRPRSGNPLRQLLFFAFEAVKRTVVMGPLAFKTKSGTTHGAETLEHGGMGRKGPVAARPTMHLAFGKEVGKVPRMWADSIRP